MTDERSLTAQMLRQARDSRDVAARNLKVAVLTARAAGLPLAAIAEATDLSVSRIHEILKEGEMSAYAPTATARPATDDVVVVAARIAYDEYVHYNAYVCQEGRSFRDVNRMGFYRHGKIERYFPSIRASEDHVLFTRDNAERLRNTGSPIDREIGDLIDTLLDHHKRDENVTYKVFLLTPTNDPQTLTLTHTIDHDTGGRGSAWTMGQRYIGESQLHDDPQTTDDL